MSPPPDRGVESARATLEEAFGTGRGGGASAVAGAWAPGRCTLVGDHVDYVGGLVLCVAIDLGVAVAVRPSVDGTWRAAGGGRRVERLDPVPAGDIGDRIFAAATALADAGVPVEPVEVGVSASLPEGAGLSSSAALICAVGVALLRRSAARLSRRRLAEVALRAERDIVGVPVGPLDHRAIIEAPDGGALLLDCRGGGSTAVPWPWPDVVLVACDTAEGHDVGGRGYRIRREQSEAALRRLRVSSSQDIDAGALAGRGLGDVELRRARHIAGETARAREAARALGDGDASRLGALMTASHESLRDDHEVSTRALDATVDAVGAVGGCFGARLVGAGFGGTVVALATAARAPDCARVMTAAAGPRARAWTLHPAAGLAARCPDAISDG